MPEAFVPSARRLLICAIRIENQTPFHISICAHPNSRMRRTCIMGLLYRALVIAIWRFYMPDAFALLVRRLSICALHIETLIVFDIEIRGHPNSRMMYTGPVGFLYWALVLSWRLYMSNAFSFWSGVISLRPAYRKIKRHRYSYMWKS